MLYTVILYNLELMLTSNAKPCGFLLGEKLYAIVQKDQAAFSKYVYVWCKNKGNKICLLYFYELLVMKVNFYTTDLISIAYINHLYSFFLHI